MKKYRFFYHFNKRTKKLTVHYRGQCISADNIACSAKVESKWNKTQPLLVMQGYAKEVAIKNGTVYIE